jgi:UDP-N-acetylmuramate dehydrogenase
VSISASHATRDLPNVRGSYRFDAALAPTTWFQVGGKADVLFKPADTQDLADFLKQLSPEIPVTVLGVGSNLIVRDGGIAGVVIKLGRGFTDIATEGAQVIAGAAALDVHVARVAADAGHAGLEFLAGIPGTMGGAIAMNAGAYGREITNVLVQCEAVDRAGNVLTLTHAQCQFSYRHFGGPEGLIFTRAWLATTPDAPEAVHARILDITQKREATQPVRERTGGSTFKNPEGHKAWELIDAAGCRGLRVGAAQISPLHCNFMINTGGATAAELQALGEEVRKRVEAHSGITLQWEIKRIGRDTL